jgi:anti-anti-sigma factor
MHVTAVGELDLAAVPELDAALQRAAADRKRVVVDLRGLDFMDSSGVHSCSRRIAASAGRVAGSSSCCATAAMLSGYWL